MRPIFPVSIRYLSSPDCWICFPLTSQVQTLPTTRSPLASTTVLMGAWGCFWNREFLWFATTSFPEKVIRSVKLSGLVSFSNSSVGYQQKSILNYSVNCHICAFKHYAQLINVAWKINIPFIIRGLRAFAHHSMPIRLILVPVCAGEDLFITGGEAASEPGLCQRTLFGDFLKEKRKKE